MICGLPKSTPDPKNLPFSTLVFDAVPVFVGAFCFSEMQIRTASAALLRGSSVSQFQPGIVTIAFFCVFFYLRFLTLNKNSFFSFWMVLGTSKIDPDPPKSMFLLKREHDFQKIVFFVLRFLILKKQVFLILAGSGGLQNRPQPSKNYDNA